MATRPTTIPQLDTTKANRTIPAGSKVTSGYSTNDFFPAASANYLHGWAGDWLEWLEERTEDGTTPTTDFTLRGLDALTLTGDGGVLTLIGGDGGGTSGDGGNILLLPGGVTSGTDGYVGIGTSAPDAPLHMLYDEPWIKLETSDTSQYSEIMFQTTGGLSRWELGAYASSHASRAGQLFIFQSTNIAGAAIGTVQLALTDGGQVQITEDLLVKGDYVRFATQNDYIYHDAGADEFQLWLDSAEHWTFTKTTLDCKQNTITECSAMVIGTGLAGVADALIIHDNTFGVAFDGTDPYVQFKGTPDAWVRYDRADDELIFHIVGNDEWMFDETTLDCKLNSITECNGIAIGTGVSAVANSLLIYDSAFGIAFDGTDPFIQFKGTPDALIRFDRADDDLIFHIEGADEWAFSAAALDCEGNNIVNAGTVTAAAVESDDYSFENTQTGQFIYVAPYGEYTDTAGELVTGGTIDTGSFGMATARYLYIPLPLEEGATITQVEVYLNNQGTSGSATTAEVYSSDWNSLSATDLGTNMTSSTDGAVTLGSGAQSFAFAADTQYYLRIDTNRPDVAGVSAYVGGVRMTVSRTKPGIYDRTC